MKNAACSRCSKIRLFLVLAMLAGGALWLPQARAEWWNENLKLVGNLSNLPGNATDVEATADRVYLKCETSYGVTQYPNLKLPYVAIVDVKNPQKPELLDTWQPQGYMNDFAVDGKRVYSAETDYVAASDYNYRPPYTPRVTSAGNMLRAVDMSNPSAPVQLGAYHAQNTITRVKVYSKRAYLAESSLIYNVKDDNYYATTSTMTILDVSHPDQPTFLGSYPIASPIEDMCIWGNHAFLAAMNGYIYIVDVSNPLKPQVVKNISAQPYNQYRNYDRKWICASGDYLYSYQMVFDGYFMKGMNLCIYKWTLPAGQEEITSYNTLYPPTAGISSSDTFPDVANIDLQHGLVFIPENRTGLQVLDVLNPYSDEYARGYYRTSGDAKAVRAYGSMIYVATDQRGLTILRYTGPRRLPISH